ncbi:MAG: hypothetical protein JXA68_00785 [Ignavibacteriales bacterium]|nr:hypothetical protein [Ignavibacteriales bacterium]
MKIYFLNIFLILILLISSNCSDSKSDYENLAKVYVDLLVVQELYLYQTDSLEIKRQEIFSKYSIKEEDYLKALEQIPDEESWDKFFNYANEYLLYLEKNVDLTK